MNLKAEKILEIYVTCGETKSVGNMMVIPIESGYFEGMLKGHVVSGGADWNTRIDSHTSHVFAKYLIQAEDGTYIAIENEGKISDSEQENRIKTSPRFKVDVDSPYSWLNSGVYVGELNPGRKEGQVHITIYKLA